MLRAGIANNGGGRYSAVNVLCGVREYAVGATYDVMAVYYAGGLIARWYRFLGIGIILWTYGSAAYAVAC